MSESSATLEDVVTAINRVDERIKNRGGKDRWDKFSAISTFLSSVVIALLGLYFTHSYQSAEAKRAELQQERQNQLRELDAIVKFMPYLTGEDELAKKTAITSIRALAGVRVAALMAELHPSIGSAAALEAISGSPQITAEERTVLQNATRIVQDALPSQEILFATNRDFSNDVFIESRGDLCFGAAKVTLPFSHRAGEIERPNWLQLELSNDPEKHVTLQKVLSMQQDAFMEAVQDRLSKIETKELLIFVHGYNMTFEDATLRTAQIAYDLKFPIVPLLFSWPSAGRVSAYMSDAESATWAQTDFTRLIQTLVEKSGAEGIHIVATSLGARLVSQSLAALNQSDRTTPINNIILLSADIDGEMFRRDLAPRLEKNVEHVTVYASRADKSLMASKSIHGTPRLGDASENVIVARGFDTVVVKSEDLLGANYFAGESNVLSDVIAILQGVSPSQRMLNQVSTPDGPYWELE